MTPRTPITGEEVADVLEALTPAWWSAWLEACAQYNHFINRDPESLFEAGWNAALRSAATAARQQGVGK